MSRGQRTECAGGWETKGNCKDCVLIARRSVITVVLFHIILSLRHAFLYSLSLPKSRDKTSSVSLKLKDEVHREHAGHRENWFGSCCAEVFVPPSTTACEISKFLKESCQCMWRWPRYLPEQPKQISAKCSPKCFIQIKQLEVKENTVANTLQSMFTSFFNQIQGQWMWRETMVSIFYSDRGIWKPVMNCGCARRRWVVNGCCGDVAVWI